MSEKPRSGSMLEAERKSIKTAKLVMVLVSLILFLIFATSVFDLYPAYWHRQAGLAAQVIGKVLFAATLLPLIFEQRLSLKTKIEVLWWIAWLIILIAAMITSSGFKFDLP